MAEIAALGLTCNVLQMLDYGRQFATTAWKIHQSGEDALESFSILQVLSASLESMTLKLEKEAVRSPISQQGKSSSVSSSHGMADLCQESIKTAREMLERLGEIGLPQKGKLPRKREALRSAFMAWWNEDRIRALQQRLNSLGNQVTLCLVDNLRFVAI